jgi:hypothetical protein
MSSPSPSPPWRRYGTQTPSGSTRDDDADHRVDRGGDVLGSPHGCSAGRAYSNLRRVRVLWLPGDDACWCAYHTDDEPSELAFFCLKCAHRKFE